MHPTPTNLPVRAAVVLISEAAGEWADETMVKVGLHDVEEVERLGLRFCLARHNPRFPRAVADGRGAAARSTARRCQRRANPVLCGVVSRGLRVSARRFFSNDRARGE